MHLFILSVALLLTVPIDAHEKHSHNDAHKAPLQKTSEVGNVTVTGEVIDLVCYLDHAATGPKHADCAKTCIEGGLPVGLKGKDGTTYILVGEHKAMNKTLAPYAAKTITVRGKHVSRDGIHMIENTEIVQ